MTKHTPTINMLADLGHLFFVFGTAERTAHCCV